MLHTKFQASKQGSSEEEDVLILSIYFYGSNPGPPRWVRLEPGGNYLNKWVGLQTE